MSSNFKGVNSAGKMKRMMSRKSHSWWWDSHISPTNSKWLAENLEEMDRSVKEMLKLIEEEGDSFAKKAEMYYQKRPELVAHVEDFYRMYRALAERYDHVTGELRKNVQSELNSQGSGSGSDLGSEPPSPSPSLPSKPSIPKPGRRAAGFDFFLGSGRSSDLYRKGSDDDSSSSSSSGSDSNSDDDTKDSNGNGDGISSGLQQRILELENELFVVKEKLHEHENCEQNANEKHAVLNSKITALETDLRAAHEKLGVSELEIMRLQQKLQDGNLTSEAINAELHFENLVISKLEEQVGALEGEVKKNRLDIEELKGVISDRDQAIEQYKSQLADAYNEFGQEKSLLEADILNLEGVVKELKAEIERNSEEKLQLETNLLEQQQTIEELKAAAAISADRFSQEKSSLNGKISSLTQSTASLEVKLREQQHSIEDLKAAAAISADKFSQEKLSLNAEISSLSQSTVILEAKLIQLEGEKAEACKERDEQIAELIHSLDDLKQRLTMLLAEKDELSERVSALTEDIKVRDNRVVRMDEHLHQLHLEHVKLMKELEEARRAGGELREQVKELEDEVEKQRVAISDGAEGKREAIRQLCFSLEHYRDGYHNLRQMLLQGNSRRPPTLMAV